MSRHSGVGGGGGRSGGGGGGGGSFWAFFAFLVVFLSSPPAPSTSVFGQYIEPPRDEGSLAGDVQNWASLIQNYILQLASDGIKREYTQVGW